MLLQNKYLSIVIIPSLVGTGPPAHKTLSNSLSYYICMHSTATRARIIFRMQYNSTILLYPVHQPDYLFTLSLHRHVMLCYVMLCYVMLCYVMLCYVMLCYVMLCYVMLCYVMLCYVHKTVHTVSKVYNRVWAKQTCMEGEMGFFFFFFFFCRHGCCCMGK